MADQDKMLRMAERQGIALDRYFLVSELRLIPFLVGRFRNILPRCSNGCDGAGRVLVSAGRCRSTTGFDRPTTQVSVTALYGGCAWGTFVCAGVSGDRSVNPCIAASTRLTALPGSSTRPRSSHAQDCARSTLLSRFRSEDASVCSDALSPACVVSV